MDQPDSSIIKSGSQHAVQIAEGSKNAKRVRNVVATDDAKVLKDRFVQADETANTEDLAQRMVSEASLASSQTRGQADAHDLAVEHRVAVPDAPAEGANTIRLQDPAARLGSGSGPVVEQRERGLQDARAEKAQAPSVHRALAPSSPATQERLLSVSEQSGRARALLDQMGATPPGEAPHAEPASAPSAGPAAGEPTGATPTAPAAGPSALLARLKAIRTHMAVTETQLERIDGSEPASKT